MPKGVALPSIQHALPLEHRPHRAALGQAAGADQDQQPEMPLGERPQIRLQPVVGRQMQHFVWVSGLRRCSARRAAFEWQTSASPWQSGLI